VTELEKSVTVIVDLASETCSVIFYLQSSLLDLKRGVHNFVYAN
jgi:hypothetical protein